MSFFFLLAFFIRLAAIFEYSSLPIFDDLRLDGLIYHRLASAFVHGNWALTSGILHLSSLYSYFLGMVYFIYGINPWGIRFVQLLLGLGSILLIFLSSQKLFGRRWALLSLFLACLYGPFIFYEMQIGSSTLGAFLLSLLIYVVLRGIERPSSWQSAVLVGIVFGMNLALRPNALLLILPIGLALRNFRSCILIFVTAFIVLIPIGLRNHSQSGEWIFTTDTGGLNFYIGNGPSANGTFSSPQELPEAINPEIAMESSKKFAELKSGKELTAKQASDFWYHRGLQWIEKHPFHWANFIFQKFLFFWNDADMANSHSYEFHREILSSLRFGFINFGWLAPFAILGMLISLFSKNKGRQFVSLSLLIFATGIALFFILGHYRLIGVPMVILMATLGVKSFFDWWGERNWKNLFLSALIVAMGFQIAYADRLHNPIEEEYHKLGLHYKNRGQDDNAAANFKKALDKNSDYLLARRELALIFESHHMKPVAIEEWRLISEIARRSNNKAVEEEAEASLLRLGQ